jgi:hypothetical protein
MARPPDVITADQIPLIAAGKEISGDSSRLLPGAAISSCRTPTIVPPPLLGRELRHQVNVSVRAALPHQSAPGQYPGSPRPDQVRVAPVARLMISVLP